MYQATLSSKFQLAIPKAIREQMHLQPGHKLALIPRGAVLELVPVKNLKEARGSLKGLSTSDYRDRSDRV